jgi:hypothetical protein
VSNSIRDTGQVRPNRGVLKIAAAAVVVIALAAVTALWVGDYGYLTTPRTHRFEMFLALVWLLFAVVFLLLRTAPVRAAVIVIVAGSLAISGAAMVGPPNTSTDSARYAWDGIVQNAGISPYAYTPDEASLAPLRPEWLFPTPVEHADGTLHCPRDGTKPPTHLITDTSGARVCTAINRADVPTIYPPSSELLFAAVRAVVPPDAQYWPLQLTGLLMSVGITLLLVFGLRRWGLDPRWAALWAFCPLVASEGVTNSHVDQLGVLLALLAVFLVAAGARWRGGILLGAAIAAKLIPVLAAPAILRTQPVKIVVGAVATFLLLYVPYIATTGLGVLGYLPGYLTEEGYDDGSRFVLVTFLVKGTAALVIAAVLLLAVAVLVTMFSDPSRPWLGQLVMIGATLVIASPRYPWYALLLIPFVVMSGRWEWMLIPLALAIHAYAPQHLIFRGTLLAAAVLIVAVTILRDLRDPTSRLGKRFPGPARKLSEGA